MRSDFRNIRQLGVLQLELFYVAKFSSCGTWRCPPYATHQFIVQNLPFLKNHISFTVWPTSRPLMWLLTSKHLNSSFVIAVTIKYVLDFKA